MTSPYEQSIEAAVRVRNDGYWSKQTLTGWRYGKWALAFWLVSAVALPVLVGMLIWSFSS